MQECATTFDGRLLRSQAEAVVALWRQPKAAITVASWLSVILSFVAACSLTPFTLPQLACLAIGIRTTGSQICVRLGIGILLFTPLGSYTALLTLPAVILGLASDCKRWVKTRTGLSDTVGAALLLLVVAVKWYQQGLYEALLPMASIRQPSLSPMWYMAALVFDEHEQYFESIMNGAACVLLVPVLLRFRAADCLTLTIAITILFHPSPGLAAYLIAAARLLSTPAVALTLRNVFPICLAAGISCMLFMAGNRAWKHTRAGNATFVFDASMAALIALGLLVVQGTNAMTQTDQAIQQAQGLTKRRAGRTVAVLEQQG